METKKNRKHLINKILVNLITGIRSLGTIAIIPIFIKCGSIAAGICSICFFFTDFIDGKLARKLNVQSFFGSLLDGLSDKSFGIVCLILLSTYNPAFLSIILTELFILYINYKSIQRGNNAKSSIAGKIKTFILAATIVSSFLCIGIPNLKESLNYVNSTILTKLFELNPLITTTALAAPTLVTNIYVINDYNKKAQKQDEKRKQELEQINENISKIEEQKNTLLQQKEQLSRLKTKKELLHDLFDTDFYIENKDKSIKKLFYK